ncbi:MAG: TonB-dependent receptor [Gemmatimonadaceae bacterium]
MVDHNAFRADRRRSLSVDAALPLTTHVRLEATLSGMDGRGATRDDADGPADTLGLYAYRSAGAIHRQVAETRVVWNAAALGVGTLGTEVNRETQRGRDSSNYGPAANEFSAHRSTRAVYAQWVGSRGRVEYSLGARLDDNTVFGTFRTARIGASVALWSGARLRGSYGNAFKAPTFLEQFNTAFSVGNQQLVPERSRGGEVGITQSAANGRVTAAATVFDQRFRDLIQYTYVDEVSPNYFNVAAASARGWS